MKLGEKKFKFILKSSLKHVVEKNENDLKAQGFETKVNSFLNRFNGTEYTLWARK